jgi:hypothetical protein
MRLRERRKKTYTAFAPGAGGDDRLRTWGERFEIRAVLMPLESNLAEKMTGVVEEKRLLLLYDGEKDISEGFGVCVEAEMPDYVVSGLSIWGRVKRAELAFIPMGRRG